MRRSKRRTSGLQAAAVAAVCILFVMTALLGLYKCFSKEPEPKPEPVGGTLPAGKADALEPGDSVPVKNPASERKERFHTILLGGLDDENGGSDTNLLVAVDAKNGKIDVISLPRDTLLDVSWPVKKLNNAYHHGGFTQTMTEVSRLLGIPVDHYVTVDLRAFVELVDAIEGVGFLASIPLWLVSLLGSLFITVMSFILILTVYGRFFRLYFYTALAPLPLASFAGEGTSFAGSAFLKSYVGVCLEGAIIVLACLIFSAFMSSGTPVVDTSLSAVTMSWQYIGETIFNMLVLVGLVKGAERIVKEMFGL